MVAEKVTLCKTPRKGLGVLFPPLAYSHGVCSDVPLAHLCAPPLVLRNPHVTHLLNPRAPAGMLQVPTSKGCLALPSCLAAKTNSVCVFSPSSTASCLVIQPLSHTCCPQGIP